MAAPRPEWSPPMQQGVSASRVAIAAGPWQTVADFLRARMPLVSDWPERLQQGLVLDAQGQALLPNAPAQPGAVLWYWRNPPPEPRVPFEVDLLHHDDHLVVVDKPHFLPVTPGGRHLHETVLVRMKKQLGISTLVPMHRLDLETAGVMAFVVRPEERNAYQRLLRDRLVHKVYEAVAPWREGLGLPRLHSSRIVSPDGHAFMQMLTVPGEPNAHTRIELIDHWPHPEAADGGAPSWRAHYRLTPRTGRQHQLRVHLCELGLPIVGDRIYPRLWPEPAPGEPRDFTQPLQLLARELAFADPVTGQARQFFSRRRLECVPEPMAPVPPVLSANSGTAPSKRFC